MIRAAAHYGILAVRHNGLRGVWIGERKLGFVGIAVSRGVCWHGFSLNVTPDKALPLAVQVARAQDAEVLLVSVIDERRDLRTDPA